MDDVVDWLEEEIGSPLNEPMEFARGNESRLGVGLLDVVDCVESVEILLMLVGLLRVIEVAIVN